MFHMGKFETPVVWDFGRGEGLSPFIYCCEFFPYKSESAARVAENARKFSVVEGLCLRFALQSDSP